MGLVGAMLLGAMAVYLAVATRIIADDKLATIYDVDALLAASISDEVRSTLDSLADKLRFFGAEQAAGNDTSERRVRALFDADDDVLSLQVYRREPDGQYQRFFSFVDANRLASLNLEPQELELAREQTPVPLEAVAAEVVVVQNASLAPDVALIRVSTATSDSSIVVTADLRPERLLRVVSKSDVYRVFLVDGSGHVLAHPDGQKVISHTDLSSNPVVRDALEAKVARGAREYQSGDSTLVSSYSRVGIGRVSVVVEAPREELYRASRELTRRSLFFAAATIALAILIALYFSRRVARPLAELEATMQRIARGELGVEVDVRSTNEIGSLAQSFNQMSRELQHRAEELDRKNAQLVQSEKLSAIGELSAGLAHEVKNPMVGIVGFAQLGQESTSLEECREYFRLIDGDAQRANGILQNLLEFARPPDVVLETLDFNQVVQGAVKLTTHQLQLNGVKVHLQLGDGLPPIKGNGNQLRQVLLNLMMNASQAMESSPDGQKHLYVETKGGDAGVQATLRDTGPGISDEVKRRLFEPFFTTKARGKGTGLGLSVSASIIEAHRGELRVESEPGKGATFFIRLPAWSASGDEAPSPFGGARPDSTRA